MVVSFAPIICFFWSSKKISASKDSRKLLFDIPPKNKDSSILTPHSLKVLITLLSDGADLAVTNAVLIGHSLILKSFCILFSSTKNDLNGPSFKTVSALTSFSINASKPFSWKTFSDSSEKITASPSKAIFNKLDSDFLWFSKDLEIIVAAATLLSIANFTSSKLLERNKWTPKSFTYLWGLSPPQKAALEIFKLWSSIEFLILKPVSEVFLDRRITSTRSDF